MSEASNQTNPQQKPTESTSNATKTQKSTQDAAKQEKPKKKGFFEKWREATAAGYEKHRANGGNF